MHGRIGRCQIGALAGGEAGELGQVALIGIAGVARGIALGQQHLQEGLEQGIGALLRRGRLLGGRRPGGASGGANRAHTPAAMAASMAMARDSLSSPIWRRPAMTRDKDSGLQPPGPSGPRA